MTDETNTTEATEEVNEVTVENGAENSEVEEVKPEEVNEVNTEEPDLAGIAKAIGEIKDAFAKFHEVGQTREETLNKVKESVDTVSKNFDGRLADVMKQHETLAAGLQEMKDNLGGVIKRLDTVESGSAIKKSLDVDDEGSTLSKGNTRNTSKWSGAFLPPTFEE